MEEKPKKRELSKQRKLFCAEYVKDFIKRSQTNTESGRRPRFLNITSYWRLLVFLGGIIGLFVLLMIFISKTPFIFFGITVATILLILFVRLVAK